MSIKDWDADLFGKQYSRRLYNTIRKTAQEIGKDVIDIFRDDALSETKPKRKKMAVYRVRKNNTLAFIDSGIDARVREYGATIRPKGGGELMIPLNGTSFRERKRRDAAKGRTQDTYVLQRPGRAPLIMERQPGKRSKPIAVLRKQVVRKAIDQSDRLSSVAEIKMRGFESKFDAYFEKETK